MSFFISRIVKAVLDWFLQFFFILAKDKQDKKEIKRGQDARNRQARKIDALRKELLEKTSNGAPAAEIRILKEKLRAEARKLINS